MNAAKSVVCMNEFKYEKYYGKFEAKPNERNNGYSKRKKEEIKKSMIKGYMTMLSNYNK